MKLSTLMVINVVVALLFGIAFVLLPGQTMSLYDITADPALKYIGQLFGSALVGFALLTWVARNAVKSDARQAIILCMLVSDSIGLVVSLIAQFGGVVNALGWSTVAIYLLLALGWGYFQFAEPGSS